MDPFGHLVVEAFPEHFKKGYDIRPTIAGENINILETSFSEI